MHYLAEYRNTACVLASLMPTVLVDTEPPRYHRHIQFPHDDLAWVALTDAYPFCPPDMISPYLVGTFEKQTKGVIVMVIQYNSEATELR